MRKILVFAPRAANSTEVPHHSTFRRTPPHSGNALQWQRLIHRKEREF
jgi:hypothetical protein